MKFIADENVPLRVVDSLRKDGIDMESVIRIKRGMSDREVVAREDKIREIRMSE